MGGNLHAHAVGADEQVVYIRVPIIELHVEDRAAYFYNDTVFFNAHRIKYPLRWQIPPNR